ncbi:MAG: ABC transporter permease [Oscillospiraceae bacterium]|nr:ABC transporter permease [Oscillospiraceae bacterium]
MSNNKAVENRKRVKPKRKRSQWFDVWRRLRRNPIGMTGLAIVIVLILTALFADIISPAINDPILGTVPAYEFQDLANRNLFPSWEYPFGTDNFGRDIFDRVVHGARISLLVGFIVVGISMIIGVALGTIAGYYGKIVDNTIMRVNDILLAIPFILLAISIAAALGAGLVNVMIAIGITNIPYFARQVRSSVLSVREQEFIEAARAVGTGDLRIMFRHILPNCMAPIMIRATMGMAGAILSAAALSFIGLGIEPPTPEWGAMLSEGQRFIRDYWQSTLFPGLAIALVVFGLTMLGDGLRDALDPRLKR